ncbi:acyl carrier protein [Leisingera thetidis]|uniref:acyl carrier protein n=1 Tax=Leisingera thetidis TaxID=2930199 RepID=UPI0021F6C818|nr:acyl carrier protein [Leisingera thetidis]
MTGHINEIIAAICEIDETQTPGSITPETRFEADLGFDSGSFIELFLILEETIPGFTLGAARLAPEDFESPRKLSDFVARRLSALEDAV